MRRSYYIFLLLLGLNFFSFKAFAQPAANLSVSVVNFPDTANVNQAYNFHFIITNIDSGSFTGAVSVKYMVEDTLPGNIGTFGSNQTGSLVQFDTLTIPVAGFTFDPNTQFRLGDNVVVVWPSVNNNPAGDSIRLPVYVPDPSGIPENKAGHDILLFPNPVKDFLMLNFQDGEELVERVRIYNLSGQMVCDHVGYGPIDLSQLVRGVYVLEAITEEQSYYRKLFKE